MKKSIAFFVASGLMPLIGFAHEGHGHTHGFTITHYIVEPDHALLTWVALTAAIVLIVANRKQAKNH